MIPQLCSTFLSAIYLNQPNLYLSPLQAARHKTLGNCQHLLKELQQPLSLDEARAFIQQQALAKDPTAAKTAPASKLTPEVEARAASWPQAASMSRPRGVRIGEE